MTYKLNPEVRKITSPVILAFCDQHNEQIFQNGRSLADAEFSRPYLIEAMSARGGHVVLILRENDQINTTDGTGEKQQEASFF